MNIDFPYHVDARGRTAEATDTEHIRDLIEQVLFTTPGERVNRPDFGSALMQLVFEPNSDEMAAAIQLLVRSSLQQWLGERIRVDDVVVERDDATLVIDIRYALLVTQEQATARFRRPV